MKIRTIAPLSLSLILLIASCSSESNSNGDETVHEMVDTVGLTVTKARARVRSASNEDIKITDKNIYGTDPIWDANLWIVCDQIPKTGENLTNNEVTFFYARNSDECSEGGYAIAGLKQDISPEIVPDLIGSNLDVAKNNIKEAGFITPLDVIGSVETDTNESEWIVCDQSAEPGSIINENKSINVIIARSC